jgi:hypothetical protein
MLIALRGGKVSHLDIKLRPGSNTIAVTDARLGSRILRVDDALGIVRDQLCYLRTLLTQPRRDPEKMKVLKEDIMVYEYISNHADGEKVAREYMRTMGNLRRQGTSPNKMEVAKMLGWFK